MSAPKRAGENLMSEQTHESDRLMDEHEKGYEAGYAQACEDFGQSSAAVAADALRSAARPLEIMKWAEGFCAKGLSVAAVNRYLVERANDLDPSNPPEVER